MMDKKNTLYLSIAGFNLELCFIPSPRKVINFLSYDGLDRKIKNLLGGFVEHKRPKSISLAIDFYQDIPIFRKYTGNDTPQNYIFFSEEKNNRIKTFQHISFSQFINLLLLQIQKLLVTNKGFLLHAAGNNIRGNIFIYTGPSGSGKSTAMSLLHNKYPSFADDSVIIRKVENNFYCYQTPFIEKNDWVIKTKDQFELGKIFFLRKTSVFKIEKITNKNYIISHLTRQLWTDKIALRKQMKYFMEFIQNFNDFYFLYFDKNSNKLIELVDRLF